MIMMQKHNCMKLFIAYPLGIIVLENLDRNWHKIANSIPHTTNKEKRIAIMDPSSPPMVIITSTSWFESLSLGFVIGTSSG